MRRMLSRIILLASVCLSASAVAKPTKVVTTFKGRTLQSSINGWGGTCASNSLWVTGSETIQSQTGTPKTNFTGVSIALTVPTCDDLGSAYTGYFQLDGSGFTVSDSGGSVRKTLVVDRSLPVVDEWGLLSWVPTGETATLVVSVNLVGTGDFFKGTSNNVSSFGTVLMRSRYDGNSYPCTATISATLDGVPVPFIGATPYGEVSNVKSGQTTVVTN